MTWQNRFTILEKLVIQLADRRAAGAPPTKWMLQNQLEVCPFGGAGNAACWSVEGASTPVHAILPAVRFNEDPPTTVP